MANSPRAAAAALATGEDDTGASPLAGMRAVVLVLADLGRSPRMQYHALSLLEAGAAVDLIAYGETAAREDLRHHPRASFHLLPPPRLASRRRLPRPLFLAYSALRFLVEGARVLVLAVTLEPPDLVLVQVPPALPAMLLASALSRLRGAKLAVDWHDFTHTQLALTLGGESRAVRAVQRVERALAPRGDANLCVSEAMGARLRQWDARQLVVLHDRPAEGFAPLSPAERSAFLPRLAQQVGLPELAAGEGERPALLVSATSWTPDEDFAPLLEALASLAERGDPLPPLVILISGRGALRPFWEERLRRLDSARVRLRTLWLAPEDYPRFLGCADVGLCFHRSSSGVDLPMKIADMFGAGLPVCAFDYGPCLAETLHHGENGLCFSGGEDLARMLVDLLAGFPRAPRLEALRHGAARESQRRWPEEWRTIALPALLRTLRG
jgi:beta-1,4-mannosyltransferase